MNFLKALTLMLALAVPGLAQAERFVLEYYDAHYAGSGVLYLKQEIQNRYGVPVQRMKLDRVMLMSKTAQGQGTATLVVSGASSQAQYVAGNPGNFNNPADWTYGRNVFGSPTVNSQGPWQIHLRGNFKVKRVVVDASYIGGNPNPPPPPPPQPPTGNDPLIALVNFTDCRNRWSVNLDIRDFHFHHWIGQQAVYQATKTIYMECGAKGTGTFVVQVHVPRQGIVTTPSGTLAKGSYITNKTCSASGLATSCHVTNF